MPKVYRAAVPIATERQTQDRFARSHVVHSHHYRSESRKKVPMLAAVIAFHELAGGIGAAVYGFCCWTFQAFVLDSQLSIVDVIVWTMIWISGLWSFVLLISFCLRVFSSFAKVFRWFLSSLPFGQS